MFKGNDPDLGKFLLRTLTLTLCACVLVASSISLIANVVPIRAASSTQAALFQPQDTPTATATDTSTSTPPPTNTPTPTPSPTTAPSPTASPTAKPTKTSTPPPATTQVPSTAVPGATVTVTAQPSATAKAKGTLIPTGTVPVSTTTTVVPGSTNSSDNSQQTTSSTHQQDNLPFLPLVTGAVLILLTLILLGVLLLRRYIAPEPLARPRISASGARPWRRTRSPESLAGDQDLQGNPIQSPTTAGGWQPQSRLFQSATNGSTGLNGQTMNTAFASAPTQAQLTPFSPASPSGGASVFPGTAQELSPALNATPNAGPATQADGSFPPSLTPSVVQRPSHSFNASPTQSNPGSGRLRRNFLFPTTSLVPTTGELPVASNLAFPPNGTGPFNGNFLFPTTSLVPPTPESFPPAGTTPLPPTATNGLQPSSASPMSPAPPAPTSGQLSPQPPGQLSPQPSQLSPQPPGQLSPQTSFPPGRGGLVSGQDDLLPPWLSNLGASEDHGNGRQS